MLQLAEVHVDRGDRSPEACSHIGMMMIRRAWLQVEGILTEDQMHKWDAMLDEQASAARSANPGV